MQILVWSLSKQFYIKEAKKEILGDLTNSEHTQRRMHQHESPTTCINSSYFCCGNCVSSDGEARTSITLRSPNQINILKFPST